MTSNPTSHSPVEIAKTAACVAPTLATATTAQKNGAILTLAELLDTHRAEIMQANEKDMSAARTNGLDEKIVNRLLFGEAKIDSRIRCLRKIAAVADPVGQTISSDKRPNGLIATRMRVPLGVIMMVYEARPHVTVNAGALCVKSGNAALLRGGSEAKECNALLGELWRTALAHAGLPDNAVQVISGTHEDVAELLECDAYISLVIPRGGKGLISAVASQSKIPVIKHFEGVCHVYIDATANMQNAIAIALDSKCLMPEVCNAMETTLIHSDCSEDIPALVSAFHQAGVTVKGCDKTIQAAPHADIIPATDEDWRTEYLDMTVSIKVVDSVSDAISHINTYGSHHTDTLVTDSTASANAFVAGIDSGVVLVNASTMFCDGETLGMGAEIGISTDKIHARGPMGVNELTTYKHVIYGDGTIMGE